MIKTYKFNTQDMEGQETLLAEMQKKHAEMACPPVTYAEGNPMGFNAYIQYFFLIPVEKVKKKPTGKK